MAKGKGIPSAIGSVGSKAVGGIGTVVKGTALRTYAAGGAALGAAAGAGGRIASSVVGAAQSSAGAFGWIFLTVALYVSDVWVTGFDGIGFHGLDVITLFIQRTILENTMRIFGAVLVMALGYSILSRRYSLRDTLSFALLIFLGAVIFFMGGFYRGTLHLAFIIIVYLGLIRPFYADDPQKGNYITAILLFIDFFGYGLLSYGKNPLLANRLIVPIWFYYVLGLTWQRSKNVLSWLLIFGVVFWNVFGILSNVTAFPAIDKEYTQLQVMQASEAYGGRWEDVKKMPKNFMDQIRSRYERSIQYAAGGYYEGEVEKGQKEPLGVYIEDIKPANRQFYEDEAVTIWATLKVKNLDEDNPVNVRVSCLSDKDSDKKKTGEMLPKESFEIYSLEEEDLQCRFASGDLEKGSRKVSVFADFNFETMAYLKNYFMDVERLRSMRRDDIDVFRHFGITDKKPIAKYTNGPVKIGIESKEPPVGLSAETDTKPLLGITLSNQDQWQGFIKKINDLTVYIPESMELDEYSCDAAFKRYPDGDIREEGGEGHKAYRLDVSEKGKAKYQNIKDFVSFRCRLLIKPEKMQEVLGGVPFATKFFRVTARYDYRLEKSTVANVVRSPGFNVQLTPAKATVNDNLICVGTHDKKDIKNVKYKFVKVDESGEMVIDPPGEQEEPPTAGNLRKVEGQLLNQWLKQAGVKKGSKIRCIMEATLRTLKEGIPETDADSSIIVIRNSPPTVDVKIQKPASSQKPLVCNGTVKDIDGDAITVRWEFSEGYFGSGTCVGLSSDKVCKTDPIQPKELNVGERIKCRMTPSDGEVSGATKEDYVIISS